MWLIVYPYHLICLQKEARKDLAEICLKLLWKMWSRGRKSPRNDFSNTIKLARAQSKWNVESDDWAVRADISAEQKFAGPKWNIWTPSGASTPVENQLS